MDLMFGVRRADTGEILAQFDNPILAKKFVIENETDAYRLEVVEKYAENIVEAFPDGKAYITGIRYVWKPYQI